MQLARVIRFPRRQKLLLTFILLFPLALFLLAGLRAVQLAREGEVPDELRDLDCDGKVSPAEWLRGGIDFRLRPSQAVAGCQDVYAAKSGRRIPGGGITPARSLRTTFSQNCGFSPTCVARSSFSSERLARFVRSL